MAGPVDRRLDARSSDRAKQSLKARGKAEAAAAGESPDTAQPDAKSLYTDPESRIMIGPDRFVQVPLLKTRSRS